MAGSRLGAKAGPGAPEGRKGQDRGDSERLSEGPGQEGSRGREASTEVGGGYRLGDLGSFSRKRVVQQQSSLGI